MLENLMRYPSTMTPRVRIAAIAALAIVAAALVVAICMMRSSGVVLYPRPLAPDQLAEVEQRLAQWGVPFTATADNVTVPASSRNDTLLRLSMAGVPRTHITTTADSLGTANALVPQSILDSQARTGLEGDLANGIRGISGIADARVFIAPATHGFFVDEPSRDGSASVRVTMEQGATLSPQAVGGIKTFVANAVAGLDVSHVSVVDQDGVALGDRAEGGASADGKALEASLQTALDSAIGAGATLVRVHVDTDAATVSSREVKRVPLMTNRAMSATESREHYSGKDKSYDKVRTNADRGSDTVERSTRVPAGATQRLSVAVFVDDRMQNQIARIRDLVSAAAGIRASRGDTLTVESIAFAHPAALPAHSDNLQLASLAGSLPAAFFAIALVVALALVGRPVAQYLTSLAESQRIAVAAAQPNVDPAIVHARIVNEPPHAAAAVLRALPSPTVAAVLEFYDPAARSEIVKRLARSTTPIVRDLSASLHG